jgi:D-alanyl-D-alanine carboxypeptidase
MRLVSASHCFVWGSLAALLCAAPANPDRHVKAALAPLDAIAALAHSDAGLAGPDLTAALADPNARAALPDPVVKVPLAEPEVNVSPLDTSDKCLVAKDCIDQYLWSVYARTRKVDTVKVQERIRVTVKKKGKSRTVMKTVTKLVNEDFTWKDPQAAQKAGMSLVEYVIGGMDRDFKVRLYHLFRALDDAGLAPGMTSGFRDDYRQSIITGNKAATGNSYHGGSRRGGYGHGLAADVVSVKGETRSERWSSSGRLWKWIDAHGKEFGIGRPYLDKDPPHIAPIDGKEYADKRVVNAKLAGKGGASTGRDAKTAKPPQVQRRAEHKPL